MADVEERESEEVPNTEDPPEAAGGDVDEEDCEKPTKKKKKVKVPALCPGNGTKLIAGIVKIIPSGHH
jgi:hypothetical protein